MYQENPPLWQPDPTRFHKFGIKREDWPWFLRGLDPLFWLLLHNSYKSVSERTLVVQLTLNMDKFRRGQISETLFKNVSEILYDLRSLHR